MKYWTPAKSSLTFVSMLALGVSPSYIQAQEAETSDEDVIELSPFVVETDQDVGYMATNSISGTRLNMEIKDVPLNLEVITSKFIQDTGATNLRDALKYSPGLVLQSQSDAFDNSGSGDFTTSYSAATGDANNPQGATRTAGDSTTKMRGFQSDYMLQDGFHRVFSADTINIERVEVLRGPSALLYGTGNFGGVVNYLTKKPIFEKQMYHFGTSVGDNAYYRGEMDINLPVVSDDSSLAKYKPAFRLTAAYEDNENNTQYYHQKHWQVNGVFSFKPLETTTVSIGAEFGHKEETGVGFQNIRGNLSDSSADASSKSGSWLTDTRYWVSTGGYDDEGEELGYIQSDPNPEIDYRSFRWSGPDTYMKGPYRNITFDLEQKIGDNMFFKLGYSNSRAEFNSRNINASMTSFADRLSESYVGIWDNVTYANRAGTAVSMLDDSGNEYFIYENGLYSDYTTGGQFDKDTATDVTTVHTGHLRYYWEDLNRIDTTEQVRAELVYKLDLSEWGHHTFIAGASYEKTKREYEQYLPLGAGSDPWIESYYDSDGELVYGNTHSLQDVDIYSYKNHTDYTPFRYGVQGDGVADNPQVHWMDVLNENWSLGYYGVYQGQFFQDRLSVVGGVRWDRVDARTVYEYVYANSMVGQEAFDGQTVDYGMVDQIHDTGGEAPTAYSPQIGINYSLNEQLSVFGVYSTGVMPNFSTYDGNGDMLEPTEATNFEFGIKYDFFDGKLSGTLSYYEIERKGVPYFVWWAPNPIGDVENGYNMSSNTKFPYTYTTPNAFYAMMTTTGLDVTEAYDLIKTIWPECWHPLVTEIYNNIQTGVQYDSGVLASNFWDVVSWDGDTNSDGVVGSSDITAILNGEAPPDLATAFYNTDNCVGGSDIYFPLIEITDGTVAQLLSGTLNVTDGWAGQVWSSDHNGRNFLKYDAATNSAVVDTCNTGGSSGCYVPMDDKAKGWDMSVVWSPINEFQLTAGFSHLTRKVTSETYSFVNAQYFVGANWLSTSDNYGTLDADLGAASVYADINDASTYMRDADGNIVMTIPMYGKSCDDSPENTFTIWARYELKHIAPSVPFIKGLAVGLGGQWEDNRMWLNGYGTSGNVVYVTDSEGNQILLENWTDERITVNGMIEYTTRLADKYDLRVALNVNNIMDDTDAYGYIYAPGRSWRLSASIDF